MHSHHIAPALADARVADLHIATPHTTATAPPRRHHRYTLALLGLAATTALAAPAPTGASAQPIHDAATPTNAAPARHDLRSPDARDAAEGRGTFNTPQVAAPARHDLRSPDARDAAEGRGTFNSPQVVVVKAQSHPRPAHTNGIDWGDAGIGAGSLLGVSLLALGGTLAITHRRRAAHGIVAPGAR